MLSAFNRGRTQRRNIAERTPQIPFTLASNNTEEMRITVNKRKLRESKLPPKLAMAAAHKATTILSSDPLQSPQRVLKWYLKVRKEVARFVTGRRSSSWQIFLFVSSTHGVSSENQMAILTNVCLVAKVNEFQGFATKYPVRRASFRPQSQVSWNYALMNPETWWSAMTFKLATHNVGYNRVLAKSRTFHVLWVIIHILVHLCK